MKKLGLLLIGLVLSACATSQAIKDIPKPQTFKQTIAYVDGQIKGLRETTAAVLATQGEDCVAKPNTALCKVAQQIDAATKQFIQQQDLVLTAYAGANGVLTSCQITYGGVTVPCQDTEDQILAGLIELQKLLPKGATQ